MVGGCDGARRQYPLQGTHLGADRGGQRPPPPPGIRELNFWLSGGNLDEIIKGERLICEWAKSMGCHRVTATGRHGWKKVFPDYRAASTVFVKELK
jgi:hypothetical protein